jgi:hypothetical protein
MSKRVATSRKYAFLLTASWLVIPKGMIKFVHDLCIKKQCNFFVMRQCLEELLVEKEQKELEH